MERISVLLVEDNPGDARLLREAVREAEGSHIMLTHVETLAKALARIESEHFDVVMLDLSLPDADGLETLVRTHTKAPSIPIVVLTGLDDEGLAIRAVREGAQDYLVKGQYTSQLLVRAMRYATERKRAVEALQQSEEYYRSLIENTLDIIAVLETDGLVRYRSPSFARTFGYSEAAIEGANVFSLIHPDDRPHVHQILEKGARQSGNTDYFECRVRHQDGTWRVLESIGRRFAAESSVNGYVLNSRDVTERKQAEEQLRELNETLRAVIETSPLAIYALDLSGAIRSWNSAAERIFGYSEREVAGQPVSSLYVEEEQVVRQRIDDAANGHLAVGAEQRCRRLDGSTIDVSVWNAQLRDAAGTVTGIVEAVADNTERKRLEEQFRQVQKMEAVGRLAGGVAHDFNNLLTVITGYCQMILDQIGASSPIYGDMEQVVKAADRATALTKQLLAFSRRQIVQPKVIDLGKLVADVQPMVKRLLGANVELAVNAQADLGKVRVDPGQIEQVIVNLAVNARDAMPDDGMLAVHIRNTSLDADNPPHPLNLPAGDYVLLEVIDTGVGMDAHTLSHLFEPFFTTKEKGKGTGLGLSTSYGIVKQNHGEIFVESEPGVGTTFSIYLPMVAEDPEASPGPDKATPAFTGTETILIAEDEDGVRTVVTDMLRKQGYTVLVANGGAAALEIAKAQPCSIDLLVTDVVMPKMGGRELADRLRHLKPGLKVLFVSGYTEGAVVREDEAESGTNFLQKPFSPDQLGKKVRDLLDAKPD